MRQKKIFSRFVILGFSCLLGLNAYGETVKVTINKISNKGIEKEIGHLELEDSEYGLVIKPNLKNLTTGTHGFHVHENPNCEPDVKEGKMTAGEKAGPHLDPNNHKTHQGPYTAKSHLGDLPPLLVEKNGTSTTPLLAPKLKIDQVKNRAFVIHEGGDTLSDNPTLGGGKGRIACGVLQASTK